MGTVNVKYLKDESGEVISPVTSLASTFNTNGVSLQTLLTPVTLWTGKFDTLDGDITLKQNYNNFRMIVVYCGLADNPARVATSTIYPAIQTIQSCRITYSYTGQGYQSHYFMHYELRDNNKLRIRGGCAMCYSGTAISGNYQAMNQMDILSVTGFYI